MVESVKIEQKSTKESKKDDKMNLSPEMSQEELFTKAK